MADFHSEDSTARPNTSVRAKQELRMKTEKIVLSAGILGRLVSQKASCAHVQDVTSAMIAHEKTISNTAHLMRKINEGVADVDETLDEIMSALPGPNAVHPEDE